MLRFFIIPGREGYFRSYEIKEISLFVKKVYIRPISMMIFLFLGDVEI